MWRSPTTERCSRNIAQPAIWYNIDMITTETPKYPAGYFHKNKKGVLIMAGFDIKEKIEHNVKKAVADFQERDDITTKFGEPVLAYVYAKDRSSLARICLFPVLSICKGTVRLLS